MKKKFKKGDDVTILSLNDHQAWALGGTEAAGTTHTITRAYTHPNEGIQYTLALASTREEAGGIITVDFSEDQLEEATVKKKSKQNN